MYRAKDYREKAWSSLKGIWGVIVVTQLIYLLIALACDGLSRYYIGALAVILLTGPLEVGINKISLNVVRKENVEVVTLFDGFKVGSNHIERIVRAIKKRTIRYSNCSESTDFSAIQCLVIDYVGELASIYRYGDCAYIGGGFTPYLHSLVEAAVYGLPVAFGPRIERKISPAQLMEAGVGTMVSTPEELISWYDSLLANAALCDSIKEKARKFVDRNSGATEKIAGSILASLPHNSATKQ